MQKIVVLALIALVAPLAPCTRAEAQTLICADHSLAQRDQKRLLAVAKSALPDDVHLQTPDVCRNPKSARAWMETERRLTAEGAQEWWTISCRRPRRAWACETPRLHRSATMTLAIDGRERALNLSFDGSISLADARDLASRAWSIYQGATSAVSACSLSALAHTESSDWTKARARYPLQPSTTELETSVEKDDDAVDVIYFGDSGLFLRFHRDPNLPPCWGEWIIVT